MFPFASQVRNGCCLLLSLGVLPLQHAQAQIAIGVAALSGSTNNDELRRPFGGSAFVSLSPASRISVRGELSMARSTRRLAGPLCPPRFSRPRVCAEGDVQSRSSLQTIALLGIVNVVRTDRLRVQGGAGISTTSVSGALRSLGSDPLRVDAYSGDGVGIPIFGVLATRPVKRHPVWISAEYREYSGLDVEGCATDIFAPFCGPLKLREWRIGVTYEIVPVARR